MSEKLLIERLKSLAAEVHGPVKEALLDSAMALTEADALAARLAESEAECLEQARLNGMGSEREARLIARLAEAERKSLIAAHALVRAFNELNAIRARDGVPRDYTGMRVGVDEEYFSSVVDDVDAAVLALTGRGAHCHPLLYERATDSAPAAEPKLWLWRNGDHFLAFEHLYPCFTPGGDPMTLGEPVGYAVVKRSFDRAAGSAGATLLTNPHTGTPRDWRDVESDPEGKLIVKAGEPLRAADDSAELRARLWEKEVALRQSEARLAEAERDRDGGWKAFYALRKAVGEDRYPGLTGVVRTDPPIRPADSAPAAPRCERCGDSGWIQGNPVIGISDEPCGCDERDASTVDDAQERK